MKVSAAESIGSLPDEVDKSNSQVERSLVMNQGSSERDKSRPVFSVLPDIS